MCNHFEAPAFSLQSETSRIKTRNCQCPILQQPRCSSGTYRGRWSTNRECYTASPLRGLSSWILLGRGSHHCFCLLCIFLSNPLIIFWCFLWDRYLFSRHNFTGRAQRGLYSGTFCLVRVISRLLLLYFLLIPGIFTTFFLTSFLSILSFSKIKQPFTSFCPISDISPFWKIIHKLRPIWPFSFKCLKKSSNIFKYKRK